jgi:hypothetical protein
VPPSAPPELARLQRGFLALVTARGTRSREARAALTEIESPSRVGVYRQMYARRMTREVAREYPATRALLGPRAFARLARAFVARHPSRSFTLEGYAEALPEFVGRSRVVRDARARRRGADLAALERDLWRERGVRVRVAPCEVPMLRALLAGAGLERAVAAAARSGLEPGAIRSAFEHWVGVGLLELRYRSDPRSIQAARCWTSAPA